MSDTKRFIPIVLAVLFTIPGFFLRLVHPEISPPLSAAVTGAAILAASFLLLWACDAAQKDISQALALAVVALIAVLPEYAVDMYFTWQAGQNPGGDYAHYAIANMTGANRLLIGVAWALIAVIFWLKTRLGVELGKERRTEILFLGLATLYAFVIPIKGSLAWYDGVVFIGLYACYIRIAGRRPCEECELDGPAELLGRLPRAKRRMATALMFLFAAGVILANAEPFSESLIATGKVLGIDEFLLVQWLAPIASEAPEFTVAVMFALRGHAAVALGSLLSAKLNQWTLLVGMIPGVYGLSSGSFGHPIPMDSFQMNELLLTAAQSLLAVALLVNLRLSPKGALLLFGLFMGQFLTPVLPASFSDHLPFASSPETVHLFFSALYIVASVSFLMRNREAVLTLRHGFRVEEAAEELVPQCVLAGSNTSRPASNPEALLGALRSTYRK
ncbi:MAG: sodium:calcium antiporter [Acidobacteriota bacterium]